MKSLSSGKTKLYINEFTDREAYSVIARDNEAIHPFVAEKLVEICNDRNVDPGKRDQMANEIRMADIDDYGNSTPIAGYALALWSSTGQNRELPSGSLLCMTE